MSQSVTVGKWKIDQSIFFTEIGVNDKRLRIGVDPFYMMINGGTVEVFVNQKTLFRHDWQVFLRCHFFFFAFVLDLAKGSN